MTEPSVAPANTTTTAEDEFPASFGQERLWFFQRFDPSSAVYNATLALRLVGALDAGVLRGSLDGIAARHETLRTTFARSGGSLVQRVSPRGTLPLGMVDVSGEADPFAAARRLATEEAERPFDLERGPLARVSVYRLAELEHVLLCVMHHTISDGWSMGVFLAELAELYDAHAGGRVARLPQLEIQYADFAHWQREWLRGETLEELLSYWRTQLERAPPVLELPADRPRPPVLSYRGANVPFTVCGSVAKALARIGSERGATPFMTLFAAFLVLMHRYTSAADIVVGTPVAGRTQPAVEPLIGFFVNTLALRVRLDDDPTFVELVDRTRRVVLDAIAHQELPFGRLIDELQPARDLSHMPVVQVMFALQNAPVETTRIGPLEAHPFTLEPRTVPYDVTVEVLQTPGGMEGQIGYCDELFDEETIERLARNYVVLLEGIADDPGRRISALPVMSGGERRLVVEARNQTEAPYARDATVHGLVGERAAEYPDSLAVSGPDGDLTYRELDERANGLAHRLAEAGAGPGRFVCVYAEPGADAMAAMLGVLKSGAAYVPIDPESPAARASFIVRETASPLVLTQSHLSPRLPSGMKLLPLDRVDDRSSESPGVRVGAEDIAYVIYTSGSTGEPKGVAVRHRNLVNLVSWHERAFGAGPEDRMGQTARLGFDASVWEIWTPLCWGASLHVADRATRVHVPALRDWIVAKRLTQCQVATLLAERLIAMEWPQETALRFLACGGEKLVGRPLGGQPFVFHDMYGPAECTVISLCSRVDADRGTESGPPPLGRPISNARVYVLDEHLEPVPLGAVGEICIAGDGVAAGYLRHPELTAERFVSDPFGGEGLLYRTGDLGRPLRDGRIEMRGRTDGQVKVRGMRVELGEIESVLGRHPGVRAAVVATDGVGADRRLVAYVVGDAGTDALRDHLRRTVPEYMIPAFFVALDELPTTPNGKVDREALPRPPAIRCAEGTIVAPRTATERQVAELWREVLGLHEAGVTDKFFDVGGNSLGIVDLYERLDLLYPGMLGVADLFEYSTVAEIAAEIDSRAGKVEETAGFEL